MKKIKVILGGRGAECYVHDVTEEQREKLINAGLLEDKMTVISVCEMLEIESIEQNARIYTGAYCDAENFYIAAYNDNNDLIWESNEHFEFNEEFDDQDWEIIEDNGTKLLVEDYIKGTYHEYQLEIDEDFDSQKLSPIIVEISEIIQIIIGLNYNGKKLENFEWGDYWSKGLYYHLYP